MFEALFNYPREAFDTGKLVLSNVSDPQLWWVGAMLGVLIIGLSVVLGRRTSGMRWWQQAPIAALQAAVLLGVIALLTGPALQTTTLEPGANSVAVLIDTSGSMSFPTGDDSERSRLTAATELAERQLTPLLEELGEVALFAFDTTASRTDSLPAAAGEQNTSLIAATDSVLASFQGMPLAAVIVLSDGADNDEGSALDSTDLAVHGIPVHTIGFGPDSMPGEVQLSDVLIPADAPPGSRVTANLVIEHSNPGEALIKVRDGATLLAAEKIHLPPDAPTVRTSVTFDSGIAGIRELIFELETPGGDVLPLNNRIDRLLTVNERKRRILYLEGEPRWEFKFLRRAVAGDEVLELVSWLRTTDRKTYRQGVASEDQLAEGFPKDRATLFGYDVVVLGSLAATSLSENQHNWLESFVSERGGSLLALAGRQALADGGWDVQPLAAALPVHLQRQASPTYGELTGRARPTRIGRTSPLTQLLDAEGLDAWSTLPELGDYQRLGELKPAATTLLELASSADEANEQAAPLLVTQPYGLGMTAILASASTWRWQMRTPPDDPRHGLFWRQLLRQLAESAQQRRQLNLKLDGEGIAVRAWVRDDEYAPEKNVTAVATVTHSDRTSTQLTLAPGSVPGMLATRYVPGDAGVQRVDVTIDDGTSTETITRFVRAGTEHKEYFSPVQNESLLRRMAEVTGGRYWRPDEIGGFSTYLKFSSTGIRVVELLPLWNLPAWFLLLVLLKLAEWGLRRRWGRI